MIIQNINKVLKYYDFFPKAEISSSMKYCMKNDKSKYYQSVEILTFFSSTWYFIFHEILYDKWWFKMLSKC